MSAEKSAAAALILLLGWAGSLHAASEEFAEDRLEKETLISDARDAIQVQVSADGDVYVIERMGALRRYSVRDRVTRSLGTVPTTVIAEGGLVGFALTADFAQSRQLYLLYSRATGVTSKQPVMRLARTTLVDDRLDPASERVLLEYPLDVSHCGGGMQLDAAGDLWWCTGDNTNPGTAPVTDQRPGKEQADALRTSANSQDLRGKILRIHPQGDGTYTIPRGNLFADAQEGRPEIYVMGCRNPYRLTVDQPSGALYWGEVGSNTEERFGSGGFDEINRTTTPGFFGWPMFVGPNTAYVRYDHGANKLGAAYVADAPLNDSRNNTGLQQLPPARPAWIWYPSEDSREFPELGNGGRAAMVGPLYRFDPALASPIKLPEIFDGKLFIYDWCRSWVKTVSVKADGGVGGIRPFLGHLLLRRPIDLKLGPDGALYLIEFGEQWGGNRDGQVSRIVYRRGNRMPVARITADALAGPAPFALRLSGATSRDPDGDELHYRWSVSDGSAGFDSREVQWTITEPGMYQATLTVSDPTGLKHSTSVRIAVGNSVPQVKLVQPRHGGFFDWGEQVPYGIEVLDAEDGTGISPTRVQARWIHQDQPASARAGNEIGSDGGAGLMRKSDCLSCHTLGAPSVGPAFRQIAERYRGDGAARERLAAKIISGGLGVWGQVPMLPHPQHTPEQTAAMVDYILALPPSGGQALPAGLTGSFTAPGKPGKDAGGRLVLTASYTDAGAGAIPPLTGEAVAVLHARRTRAALFDAGHAVTIAEVSTLRRARRICVQLGVGSHLVFQAVDLAGIARIRCEVSASTDHGGVLELHADSPTGPLIGRSDIPVTGQWDNWQTVSLPVSDPGGVHDLYVVGAASAGGERKRFNLDVLEFERAPPTNAP